MSHEHTPGGKRLLDFGKSMHVDPATLFYPLPHTAVGICGARVFWLTWWLSEGLDADALFQPP